MRGVREGRVLGEVRRHHRPEVAGLQKRKGRAQRRVAPPAAPPAPQEAAERAGDDARLRQEAEGRAVEKVDDLLDLVVAEEVEATRDARGARAGGAPGDWAAT